MSADVKDNGFTHKKEYANIYICCSLPNSIEDIRTLNILFPLVISILIPFEQGYQTEVREDMVLTESVKRTTIEMACHF